ncbi:hypothetical protein V2H45_23415 [Tumidithrix elongata RA019]|uniref:Uncharacterized protein n=1 Tax=Tumidithrix elongata BACA0141 TaxID=2716417 RepID=A0AAW9Q852_9CYAN|nr:hypothetical protein [Tumidithrix elongata RA019]
MNLKDFIAELRRLLSGLLYISESDFPVEVAPRGLPYRMPEKGEVRSLDRVFQMRNLQDWMRAEEQATAQRWQTVYDHIANNTIASVAWHYPVNRRNYTHEQIVILLHPQGVVGLRIKLVET